MKKLPIVVGTAVGAIVGVSCISRVLKKRELRPEFAQMPLDIRIGMMCNVLDIPVTEVSSMLKDDKDGAEELIKAESSLSCFKNNVYLRFGMTAQDVETLKRSLGISFADYAEYMWNYGYDADSLCCMSLNEKFQAYYKCRELDAVTEDDGDDDFNEGFGETDEPEGGTIKTEDFSQYMNPPEDPDEEDTEAEMEEFYKSGRAKNLQKYLGKYLYEEDVEKFLNYVCSMPVIVRDSIIRLRNHTSSKADAQVVENDGNLEYFKSKGLHSERIYSMPKDAWNEFSEILELTHK